MLVIDCLDRELLGWPLSRSGKTKTAESALEQTLLARFRTSGRVKEPFFLRPENGFVFASRRYIALASRLRSEAASGPAATPRQDQRARIAGRVPGIAAKNRPVKKPAESAGYPVLARHARVRSGRPARPCLRQLRAS